MRTGWLAAVWWGLCGCASSPRDTAPSASTSAADGEAPLRSPIASALEEPAKAAPLPSSPSARSAGPPSVDVSVPFASCARDADCGWDDDCAPKRCGRAASAPRRCEESAKAPGACACVLGACTLKPEKIPPPTGKCDWYGCAVDRGGARCVEKPGTDALTRADAGGDLGPSCACVDPKRGCSYHWGERFPCKSAEDCWLSPEPGNHPIARPKGRRGPFKPCKDGEIAPACGADGFCARGAAYKC